MHLQEPLSAPLFNVADIQADDFNGAQPRAEHQAHNAFIAERLLVIALERKDSGFAFVHRQRVMRMFVIRQGRQFHSVRYVQIQALRRQPREEFFANRQIQSRRRNFIGGIFAAVVFVGHPFAEVDNVLASRRLDRIAFEIAGEGFNRLVVSFLRAGLHIAILNPIGESRRAERIVDDDRFSLNLHQLRCHLQQPLS